MRVRENQFVQSLKRWRNGSGIADTFEPSVLVEIHVGHLTPQYRGVDIAIICRDRKHLYGVIGPLADMPIATTEVRF